MKCRRRRHIFLGPSSIPRRLCCCILCPPLTPTSPSPSTTVIWKTKDRQRHWRWQRWQPRLCRGAKLLVRRVAAWLGEESEISVGGGAYAQVQGKIGKGASRGWVKCWSERGRCHQRGQRSWGGSSTNWSVFDFNFERGGFEWGFWIREHVRTDQISWYSHQLLLSDGFGVLGQHKLISSLVLVVGAGDIGSTLLIFLAASGVECITVVEHEDMEVSNIQQQLRKWGIIMFAT